LNRRGIKRVRPLAGGFTEWVERGNPVQGLEEEAVAAGR